MEIDLEVNGTKVVQGDAIIADLAMLGQCTFLSVQLVRKLLVFPTYEAPQSSHEIVVYSRISATVVLPHDNRRKP